MGLGVELDRDSRAQQRVLLRKQALEALLQVADHPGLIAGEAPTIKQFDQAADELDLDWSGGKVIRPGRSAAAPRGMASRRHSRLKGTAKGPKRSGKGLLLSSTDLS
jgi:hypothetical protein